jgi:hypothetical protein
MRQENKKNCKDFNGPRPRALVDILLKTISSHCAQKFELILKITEQIVSYSAVQWYFT